ncbi:MAG: TrbI/VirB10 family protein [Pseudomonadota bacterium]|nr:TrbI/VirB10 family protein [Pseudomonadota bacterium]
MSQDYRQDDNTSNTGHDSSFTGYDPNHERRIGPGAISEAHTLQEEPVLTYGAARKLNRKGLAFLAAIGLMGLALLTWAFSQFSLFGKSAPEKPTPQTVVIPEDAPVPPIPAAAPPVVAEAPDMPPLPAAIPVISTPPPAEQPRPAAPVDTLQQKRLQSAGLVMNGEKSQGDDIFKVTKDKAQLLMNPDFLLTRGTYVRCVLETRIITDVPGFTTCVVTEPVYSTTGRHILIPKGSKISGEYKQGSAETGRVAVIWDRVLTPDGMDVSLSSPGADGLGAAGHPGHVDRHWGTRLGAAVLVSMISDLVQIQTNRMMSDKMKTTTTVAGTTGAVVQQTNPYQTQTAATLQSFAQSNLAQLANIPTTVSINQGELINIYTSRDIDFAAVLE